VKFPCESKMTLSDSGYFLNCLCTFFERLFVPNTNFEPSDCILLLLLLLLYVKIFNTVMRHQDYIPGFRGNILIWPMK
jgi:hypothetical protein